MLNKLYTDLMLRLLITGAIASVVFLLSDNSMIGGFWAGMLIVAADMLLLHKSVSLIFFLNSGVQKNALYIPAFFVLSFFKLIITLALGYYCIAVLKVNLPGLLLGVTVALIVALIQFKKGR